MANGNERVFVGTVGEGLYISNDGGETFKRPSNNGLYIEGEVRALASHPDTPARIFAGTHAGVYRSTDGGDTWQRMDSPMDRMQVWALMVLPGRSGHLCSRAPARRASTAPPTAATPGMTRNSARAGSAPVIEFTRITTHRPPIRSRRVRCGWGWRSTAPSAATTPATPGAGTRTGLSSLDVHGMVVVPVNGSRTLVAATNNGVNVSGDEGASWQRQDLSGIAPWNYFRGIRQQAGRPETIFLGNGNGPPRIGRRGAALAGRRHELAADGAAGGSQLHPSGTTRRTPPIPSWCTRTPVPASCTAPPTAATGGPSCATSSARYAP